MEHSRKSHVDTFISLILVMSRALSKSNSRDKIKVFSYRVSSGDPQVLNEVLTGLFLL